MQRLNLFPLSVAANGWHVAWAASVAKRRQWTDAMSA